MKIFKIRTTDTHKILFSGQFANFKARLEEAVNQGLKLKNANLKHTNLANANLDDAHLEGADFSFANLTGANLSETHMQHTTWRGASLYNACLAEAKLHYADMRFAGFGATDFTNADISNALFSLNDAAKIDFFNTRAMENCTFQNNHNTQYITSKPPISLSGLLERPIIFINNRAIIENAQNKPTKPKHLNQKTVTS